MKPNQKVQLAFYILAGWTFILMLLLIILNSLFPANITAAIILLHVAALIVLYFYMGEYVEEKSTHESITAFYVNGKNISQEIIKKGTALNQYPSNATFNRAGKTIDITKERPKDCVVYLYEIRKDKPTQAKNILVDDSSTKKESVQKPSKHTGKETQKDNPSLEKEVEFKPVEIENFNTRKSYDELKEASNGLYLEVTPNFYSTHRVVEVVSGLLPKLVMTANQFVSVSDQERPLFSIAGSDYSGFEKFTPGSYVDSGYYCEVDLNNQSLEYVVYAEKRLPPTSATGHRWIKVNTRRVISKPDKGKTTQKIVKAYEGPWAKEATFEPLKISNIKERPTFKGLEEVKRGHYLEITERYESTHRILEARSGSLPKVLIDTNKFIEINETEVNAVSIEGRDFTKIEKFTPGSYTDPGYYCEVDPTDDSMDYVIYTERRLPPTRDKGYRWVKVAPRKINDQ